MTKKLPWAGRFAIALILPIGILPFVYSADQHSQFQRAVPNDPAGPAARIPAAPRIPIAPAALQRTPKISDWTNHYLAYTQTGFAHELETLRKDPRAQMRWREIEQRNAAARLSPPRSRSNLQFGFRNPTQRFPIRQSPAAFHTDWNISLGAGSTAPGMFPAKYQFNTAATADCTNDFMVFPVNVGSTNGQPNIVAFNNLYSGTTTNFLGVTVNNGLCIGRTTPGGHTDTKSSPTVYWSYNIHAINTGGTGGGVATSPALSLDGTKVAFVETAAGSPAHFHVLAWKATDGQAANLQTVTGGKEITSFTTSAPTAGSGSVTDLALGTTTDTNSSPYIDYSNDTAYVGNDAGTLYRIKNVFCTTAACGTLQPQLDSSWGSAGAVTTGCTGVLTGAIQDFPSLNVYVGCSNGKLYGFNSVGTPLANSPVAIGDGTATGDIADSPVVDPLNGLIYVVSGSGSGNAGKGVLVQLPRDLSSSVVAIIGKNVGFSLHAPAFNDAYFTSTTSSSWILYAQAFDTTGLNLTFFGAAFNASRVMNGGAITQTWNYGTRLGEGTPLTEFKSGTTDWLFHAEVITPSNMGENNINAFPTSNPVLADTGTPGGCTGITGMIVDNNSTSAQAASIYFTCTGSNVAYKFTQNGLN